MRRSPLPIVLALLALVLPIAVSCSAHAAAATGGIRVRVVDDARQPLPGVRVTLSHQKALIGTTNLTTDARGTAEFPVLRADGGYVVSVSLPGFATVTLPGTRVKPGQVTEVPVVMTSTSPLEEQVEVRVDRVGRPRRNEGRWKPPGILRGRRITLTSTGAAAIFTGMVRGETKRGEAHETEFFEYESYVPMAEAQMKQVAVEMRAKWPVIEGIAIVQRIGKLYPKTPTVLIACTAAHRDTGAFEAARYGIDRLKEIVPIWKKEVSPDGQFWVEGEYIPKAGE